MAALVGTTRMLASIMLLWAVAFFATLPTSEAFVQHSQRRSLIPRHALPSFPNIIAQNLPDGVGSTAIEEAFVEAQIFAEDVAMNYMNFVDGVAEKTRKITNVDESLSKATTWYQERINAAADFIVSNAPKEVDYEKAFEASAKFKTGLQEMATNAANWYETQVSAATTSTPSLRIPDPTPSLQKAADWYQGQVNDVAESFRSWKAPDVTPSLQEAAVQYQAQINGVAKTFKSFSIPDMTASLQKAADWYQGQVSDMAKSFLSWKAPDVTPPLEEAAVQYQAQINGVAKAFSSFSVPEMTTATMKAATWYQTQINDAAKAVISILPSNDFTSSLVSSSQSVPSAVQGLSTAFDTPSAAIDTAQTIVGQAQTSGLFSLSIMMVIVALLYFWELSVESVREDVSKTFQPVVERMLGEVAGLGFIGLVLQTVALPLKGTIDHLSEKYLGNDEILFESFEFLHSSFFQVGTAFFGTAAAIVAVCVYQINRIEQLNGIGLDDAGTCTATKESLAEILEAEKLPTLEADFEVTDAEALRIIRRKDPLDELCLDERQRAAEALLIREYLIQEDQMTKDEMVEPYLEQSFASSLFDLVKLNPLTWLPLIPALALANSIDISHGVVNAASPNAADTAGLFYSTPGVLIPSLVITLVSVVWSCWNFWKMASIKSMLMPTLVRDELGQVRILPPRASIKAERNVFRSSPSWIEPIEELFSKPAKTIQHTLFGVSGAAGPELYLSSIRFNTWLCITSVVFFGTQIVTRDIGALLNGVSVGGQATLVPELLTFGIFVVISIGLLTLAPTTFLNYCIVNCLEQEGEVETIAEELLWSAVSARRNRNGAFPDQPENDGTDNLVPGMFQER